MLLYIKIIDNTVVTDAATPSGGLSLKAFYVTSKRILLH